MHEDNDREGLNPYHRPLSNFPEAPVTGVLADQVHMTRPLSFRTLTGLLLAAAFALGGVAPSWANADGWKLAADSNDVRVWKRDVPDSPFVEFRAETTVKSSLAALVNLFYDLDAAPTWLDHTRRVAALRRDDTIHEYVLLIETDMPWPIKDRDAVIQGRWWQEQGTMAVLMRARSVDVHPVNPDYVRNVIRSDWTFIPQGGGRVKVVMGGHVDPGGNLPTWAVNLLIQESPLATLGNLRKIVADPKRQANRHPDIMEPPEGFVPPLGR